MDRYEKALELARAYYDKDANAFLDTIFPELNESEDERIRNLIYCLIRDRSDNQKLLEHNGVSVDKALAYLERQKERGPLSKDEEYTLARIIEYLEDNDCPSEWKALLDDIYSLPATSTSRALTQERRTSK